MIFAWLCFLLASTLSEIDSFFEQRLSGSAIVQSRQIKIPGYPHAYNPSLIPYKQGYLLSFRYTSGFPETVNGHRKDASFIGIAKLDKKFKVSEKSIHLLHIQSYSSKLSLTTEDGRLVKVEDRIFLFFNDLPPNQSKGFAMYFTELEEENGIFVLKEPAKLLNYPGAISIEKNWSPFFSEGQLYVIYSDQPRIILEVNIETGDCRQIPGGTPDWKWNLGQIRGGTPAYLVDGAFLTFFHSSFPANISKGRAYAMGAYLFDRYPPFSVRAVTPNPLGNLSDYTDDNSFKVIFPSGMVVNDDSILIAWGKGDRQIWITTFDKKKLFSSLESLRN